MSDELYETMSDEQLQQNALSFRRELNANMTEQETLRSAASKLNSKLDKVNAQIMKRSYSDMVQHFELNEQHVALLKAYGANVAEITASELEIAETLGWEVADTGLTERQEANLSRLLTELKYAQDYINSKSSELVNAEGPKS